MRIGGGKWRFVKRLFDLSRRLQRARDDAARFEQELQQAVAEHLREHGNLADLAQRMGFSRAYLCDVKHGRRGISSEFLKRLAAAEASE